MADDDSKKEIIKDSIRGVPDFPKPGILFWDVTTIMLNPKAFKYTIDLFVKRYVDEKVDVVAGALTLLARLPKDISPLYGVFRV